jgi:hypothetical protein
MFIGPESYADCPANSPVRSDDGEHNRDDKQQRATEQQVIGRPHGSPS